MTQMVVRTATGSVRGDVGQGVATFLGVPYAEPPFGENLFAPPKDRREWNQVRDCRSGGPACPQPFSEVFGALDQGEDCLSVNVWAPADADGLPVMLWIHGGAFTFGSNSGDSGRSFARSGVVFVSCNYRLGAFGFLHAGHLDGAAADLSGCYGLADQVAALRWIQTNIAAFGGDPAQVTVFGSSAGATSVLELVGSPAANRLFHRAIAQSPVVAPLAGRSVASAEVVAELLLDKVGVGFDELRMMDPHQIVQAQARSRPTCAEAGIVGTPTLFRSPP